MFIAIAASIMLYCFALPGVTHPAGIQADTARKPAPQGRQLAAVRGEIVKIARASGKGMLLITVRPSKDFAEVTILARENDLVGSAVGHSGESDLLGLLTEDD